MPSTPMLRLSPAQATPRHRALFDPGMPAALRCFAVLEGRASGVVFTGDAGSPTWGAVREDGSGTVYLGGSPDAPTVSRLVADLRRAGDVLIGMWPGDERLTTLPLNPDYAGFTLEFTDRASTDQRWRELAILPPGCEILRMDRALFDRCLDRDYYTAIFGDADRALSLGIGVCLLQQGEIVCEAFAGPDALGTIEIAAISQESHRRRGYAAATCAHLIGLCESRGLNTYWNCASQNEASAGLARKLGYRTEREYRLLAWFHSRT